jgi:hypothetical protein
MCKDDGNTLRGQAETKLSKSGKEKEALSKEVAELKVALLQAKADRARKPNLRLDNSENVTPNILVRLIALSATQAWQPTTTGVCHPHKKSEESERSEEVKT